MRYRLRSAGCHAASIQYRNREYARVDRNSAGATADLNGSLTEIYQTQYDLIYTSMHLSFYPTSMPPQAAEALGVMVVLSLINLGQTAVEIVAQQLRHPRGQAVVFAVAHRPAVGIAQTRPQRRWG
jgi:hypothetical protein